MKKRLLFAVAGALVCLGLVAPASADVVVTNAGSANAYWESYERISGSKYRITVWYVGVYSGTESTFSDVYRDVMVCDLAGEEGNCTLESSAYGAAELTAEQFTIDNLMLDKAHLDATYPLQSNDAEGNPIGDPVLTHVVTDWSGDGVVQRDRGAGVYSSGCMVFAGTFLGANRGASATGAFGNEKLAESYGAGIGSFLAVDVFETC